MMVLHSICLPRHAVRDLGILRLGTEKGADRLRKDVAQTLVTDAGLDLVDQLRASHQEIRELVSTGICESSE